ncbi:MAG: methyltransferase domain-containing protein [Synechococcales bacterium]|nr:methyltransferase domain-containing protein [Synechococcales bacterium]
MTDYQVKFETIAIADRSLYIRSLKDNQQFCDPEGIAENLGISSAMWPFFGLVWPASRVLAKLVSQMSLQNKRILEVGCGIGLASLVAHQMGADITASDYHPMTQSFLLENSKLNDLAPIPYQTGNWGEKNSTLGKFDLIVGSDVLYEVQQADILAKFLAQHSSQDGEIMIIDPNRGNRTKFNRALENLGYSCTSHKMQAEEHGGLLRNGYVMKYQNEN